MRNRNITKTYSKRFAAVSQSCKASFSESQSSNLHRSTCSICLCCSSSHLYVKRKMVILQCVYIEMLVLLKVCRFFKEKKSLSHLCLHLFDIFQFSPCRLLSHSLVLYLRVILFVIARPLCKSVDSRRLFYVFCC